MTSGPYADSRARVALAAALLLAAAGAMALVAFLLYTDGFSARMGPLRIRARDEIRPFLFGATSAVLLAWVGWRQPAWRRTAAGMLLAFVVLGLIGLARHQSTASEVGDGAVLELHTLQASRGTQLLGPYSRFGWHHPGPAYFYLQVPWYVLSGYRSAGMQAGALAINLMALAALAWTLARYASAPLALASSGLAALYVLRESAVVATAWNPHVIVLPCAAFVVLCAAMASGALWLLPWIACAASFLVQTHIAMIPVVGAVGSVAFASAVRLTGERDAGGAPTAVRRIVNRTAWVLAALWILPIAEQLTHAPGNFTRLWRFFVLEQHPGQPLDASFFAWADAFTRLFQLRVAAPNGLPLQPGFAWWPVLASSALVSGVVVAAVVAFRRGRRFDAWLAVLSAVAAMVALWSTTRITEAIFDHEVFWMSVLGLLTAAAIAGALVPAIRHETVVAGVCCAVLGLGAVVGIREIRRADRMANNADDRAVQALFGGIQSYIAEAHVRRPLVRVHVSVWTLAAGALLQVHKTGSPFSVEDNATLVFGDALAANGTEDVELVFAGPLEQPALAARPGNRLVVESRGVFVDALPLGPTRAR